jgi:hypothetical protein
MYGNSFDRVRVGICLHIDASSFALGVMNLHNAMDLELDVVTQGAQVGTYQCWLGIGFKSYQVGRAFSS